MGAFFKKYWCLLLVVIIVLLLVIIWLLLTGKASDQKSSTSTNDTSQSTDQTTSDSKKLTETESDAVLLKKAVSEKTGIDINIIVVEVSKNTGKYAKGTVTAEGEMTGGGYWLAVKENGKWRIVFDGQSTPECSLVDPPGFPADMVPECFDTSGNIVTRN